MKRLLAALLMTTALTAPAQADPVSIGVAAAASAFSAAASGTAAGVAAGLTFGAAVSSLSAAALATSAVIGGVLAGVTQALNGRQKAGSGAPNAALRQPSPVLPLVYGETRTGGFARVYAAGEASSAERRNLYSVWVLAAREIESILEIWDGDKLMWSAAGGVEAPYDDRLLMLGTRTGAAGQSLPSTLVAALPTTLDTAGEAETNAHLEGLPYVALRFSNVAKRWTRGTPSSMWFKVRGHKVDDPRDDSTGWTRNLALIAADYVRSVGGAAGAYLDDDNISAAANLCDEAVALDPSGTQPRYTFDGSIATDAEPRANLIGLMAHAAGQAVWTGDRLLLQPGAFSASVVSFGPDDFVAPVSISAETLLEDHIDGVAGVFTSVENGFNATEYPRLVLDDYDPGDGEARLLPLDLPGIGDADRAQRVALLSLRQTRRLKKFSFAVPLNAANAALLAWDRVSVSLPAIGLTATAQIVSRRSVYDPAGPRVEIEALEDGATFWTWGADTALAAPVSVGSNFPSSAVTEPPAAPLTVVASTRLGADGTIVPTLLLTWGASPDAYLDDYEVTWVTGGKTRVARTTALEYEIYGEAEGASLAIEVRAVNTLGVRSEPLTEDGVAVEADITPPPVPVVLSSGPVIDGARFVFAPSSAKDWAAWVGYEVAEFAAAPAISAAAPRWAVDDVTVLGMTPSVTRRWWWRSIDRSGNQSDAVGPYDITPARVDFDTLSTAVADAIADAEAEAAAAIAAAAANAATLTVVQEDIARIESTAAGANQYITSDFTAGVGGWAGTGSWSVATEADAITPGVTALRLTSTGASGLAQDDALRSGDLDGRSFQFRGKVKATTGGATVTRSVLAGIRCVRPNATEFFAGAAIVPVGENTAAHTYDVIVNVEEETAQWAPVFEANAESGDTITIDLEQISMQDVSASESVRAYAEAGLQIAADERAILAADIATLDTSVDTRVAASAASTLAAYSAADTALASDITTLSARVGQGANLIRLGTVGAEHGPGGTALPGWLTAQATSGGSTFNGWYARLENGSRETAPIRHNPNGRKYRVRARAWNASPDVGSTTLRIGLIDATSFAVVSDTPVLRAAGAGWADVDVTVTGTADATAFLIRVFCALPPAYVALQSLIVEDVTVAAEVDARVTSEANALATDILAVASDVTTVEASVGGLSATVTTQATAIADIEGNLSATYSLRVGSDGVGAAFEIVASDDADGATSAIRLKAANIILDGAAQVRSGFFGLLTAESAWIGEANIENLAVTTIKIGGLAVTTEKIGDSAVTDGVDTSSSTDITGTALSGVWETVVDIPMVTPNTAFFKISTRIKAGVNNNDLLWCRVLLGGQVVQSYSWLPFEDFDVNDIVTTEDWAFIAASGSGIRIQIRRDTSISGRTVTLDSYDLEIAWLKK